MGMLDYTTKTTMLNTEKLYFFNTVGAEKDFTITKENLLKEDRARLTQNESDINDNANAIIDSVRLSGAQSIADVKTFTSSPIIPAPTTDLQAATKKYVDDTIVKSNTGWLITSGWTVGNGIIVNHGLNTSFDDYFGHVFVRDPAVPTRIYSVMTLYTGGALTYGQQLNGITGDLNNCLLQMGDGTTPTGRYMNTSGTPLPVPLTWEYKINFYKL